MKRIFIVSFVAFGVIALWYLQKIRAAYGFKRRDSILQTNP